MVIPMGEDTELIAAHAVEEIARVDGSQAATIAAGNSLGIGPLNYFGSESQKKKYLPPLCRGEALWGFGLTEPTAGSDAGGSKTTAVRDGDHYVLNGTKLWVTNGKEADICIVFTRTEDVPGNRGLTAFIVEKGMPEKITSGFSRPCSARRSALAPKVLVSTSRAPASWPAASGRATSFRTVSAITSRRRA